MGHLRARELARTVIERASALAAPAASDDIDDCGAGLQRHNRLLHGTGIAMGLDVTVGRDSAGSRVRIAPGLALDPAGNEIVVERPVHLAPSPEAVLLLVLLRYAERPCRPAPVVASATVDASSGGSAPRSTRIVETFSIVLATAPAADSVPIARLRQVPALVRQLYTIVAQLEKAFPGRHFTPDGKSRSCCRELSLRD